MLFDRKKFFDATRAAFGTLSPTQVAGLNSLLDSIAADGAWDRIRPDVAINRIAYSLATVKHETADTFQPIDERGGNSYFESHYGYLTRKGRELGNDQPGDGARFHGEGDVQLTGKRNYRFAEGRIRTLYPDLVNAVILRTGKAFDLVRFPALVKEPDVAYAIMAAGMTEGWFTRKKFNDFINATSTNYFGSRKIINGLDCAEKIEGHAEHFEKVLRIAFVLDLKPAPAPTPAPATPPAPSDEQNAQAPAPAAQNSSVAPQAEEQSDSLLDEIPITSETKEMGKAAGRRVGRRLIGPGTILLSAFEAGNMKAITIVVLIGLGLALLIYFERKPLARIIRKLFTGEGAK